VDAEPDRYRYDHFTDGYMRSFDTKQIAGEQLESLRSILRRAGTSPEAVLTGSAILDIGCARGHFLHELESAGALGPLTGVDISQGMTDWGRQEFHLDLRCATIEEVELVPASFGLITAFDVLEHVPHPRMVVARILDLLRPGGWAILEVPSETTTFRTLSRLGYRLSGGRLQRPIRTLYHCSHLSYFTAASLRRLLESLGAGGITISTKEAHVTRFGVRRYCWPARCAIRLTTWADKLQGTQAKLLCAFRRHPAQ
jgi:SAM-dependent methyltransferase